jgi:hypothetical protein
MLECAGQAARSEDLVQFREFDFLAHVVEHEYENGTFQSWRDGLRGGYERFRLRQG